MSNPETPINPNEGFIMPSDKPSPWADHIPVGAYDTAHDVVRHEAQEKKAESLRANSPKHLAERAMFSFNQPISPNTGEGIINGSAGIDPNVAAKYRR